MSGTAAEQLRRVLQLVPELADGEEHPIDAVAARLGVTRKVLWDDLVSLTNRFDEPAAFVEGVTVAWDDHDVRVRTRHLLRPMRLTMRELCALELGLAMLRRERSPDEWNAIDRALERLRGVITRVPADERWVGVQHAEVASAGDVHLPVLRSAIRERRKLEITYRASGEAGATTRHVCPYSLVFAQGMWYVVAFCDESAGLRFYRLDRIESVDRAGDERFEIPADFSIETVVSGDRVFHAESPRTMTVRYSPRIARWIAEREGKVLAADGSLTLEHPLADDAWAVRHVLQYGPDAEVLEPESLRAEIASRLSALRETLA